MGMVLIITKSVPALAKLPEASAPVLSNSLKRGVKRVASDFPDFSLEKFLQKALSKSKILILKAEHKVDGQLKKIRKKNKTESKKDFSDDKYWDELKKEVDDE